MTLAFAIPECCGRTIRPSNLHRISGWPILLRVYAGKSCYVDSHGQSEVGFAFSHLLGFQLLPRLKGIARQKLYRPDTGAPDFYPGCSRC